MIAQLIEDGILSEEMREFTIDDFLTFDIEVIQRKVDGQQLLSPISIGVGSTFTPEMYFERDSSSPGDGDVMVAEFMDYLVDTYSAYKLT